MRHSQRGITFIGWLFLLVPIGICLYAGIRLAPIYLNYMRVAKSLSELASEAKSSSSSTPQGLRTTLGKHFDIHREGDHFVAIADYEDVAPMFGNVSLLVQFHKQVDMQ